MIWDIEMDRFGNLIGRPRNKRVARRIAKHMEEMTGHYDSSFYIQQDYEVEIFLSEIPRSAKKDIMNGWTVEIRVDPWTIAHFYGWDCHTLFE